MSSLVRRLLVACLALAAIGLAAMPVPTATAAVAPATRGGVLINEVSAAAWQGPADEDGDVEDWLELHNPLPAAVDLTGYGLSDKASSPFRWVFPAGTTIRSKGYLTVWLSGKDRAVAGRPLHANFGVGNGSDAVYLTASDGTAAGTTVDVAAPAFVTADRSWCRMPSGSPAAGFRVCQTPTKDAVNAGAAFAATTAAPVISPASGFAAGPVAVTIAGGPSTVIRYTLDGSEPTAASARYTGPLTVTASAAVRAIAVAPGQAHSPVQTATYVVGAGLPAHYATRSAVLVAMPPGDLARLNASDQALRSRASFQLLVANRTSLFRQDAEARFAGQLGSQWSPQKSMNVTARDAFGAGSFDAALWPAKPGITKTKSFRLRNGSNDWDAAHLRDQFAQSAAGNQGPNLYSSSRSVAVFVNGRYYGLMDLREREDHRLVAQNTGVDPDLVDDLSDPLLPAEEINNGGDAALADYRAMHEFVTTADLSVPAAYDRAVTLLDPDSLAWDWALHLFTGNHDWPGRNVHVWRSQQVDGRWHWAAHDMDFSFGRYDGPAHDMTTSFSADGSELVRALLRNPTFRARFLTISADQLNLLTPAALGARLDVLVAEMRPYITDFYAVDELGTEATWTAHVADVRSYVAQREGYHDAQLRSWFGLAARVPVSVSVNDRSMGTVTLGSLDLDPLLTASAPTWTGRYYPDVPVTLTARPRPGYAFVGWQGASTAATPSITAVPVAGAVAPQAFTAVFAPLATPAPPALAAITERTSATGDRVTLQPVATDPQGYRPTWSAKHLPKGVDINPATGRIHGLITTPGEYSVDVSVTGGALAGGKPLTATTTFTWTVVDRPGSGARGRSPDAGPGIGDPDPTPYTDPLAPSALALATPAVAAPLSTASTTPRPTALGQSGGRLVVSGAGADTWAGTDEYGAIYRQAGLRPEMSVTAKVESQDATDPWAQAGVVIRNAVGARTPGYALLARTPGNGVAFAWDADGDGTPEHRATAGYGTAASIRVRLTRIGTDRVTGSWSADGVTFHQVGPVATLARAAVVLDAGVQATSHSTTAVGTSVFSGLALTEPALPAGPVRAPLRTASATLGSPVLGQAGDRLRITGRGADVGPRADEYGAIYSPSSVAAGHAVSARVDAQTASAAGAKAGVALRAGLAGRGTRGYAIMVATPGDGLTFGWDSNGDGRIDRSAHTWHGGGAPVWVRLVRVGANRVAGSWSADGVTYRQLGPTVTLTGAKTLEDGGVIFTSGSRTAAGTAVFGELTVR